MDLTYIDIKHRAIIIFATVGGVLFGEFDILLQTLMLFMCIDYITGLTVAGIYNKSNKTSDGRLSSSAGFTGLMRKGMILLVVLVAYRLDLMAGSNVIRNAVISFFVANEVISINENAVLMGVDVPSYLIDVVKRLKNDKNDDNDKQ